LLRNPLPLAGAWLELVNSCSRPELLGFSAFFNS
jgi:hypothetical protein